MSEENFLIYRTGDQKIEVDVRMKDERLKELGGSISHHAAIKKAHAEYGKYQARTLDSVEKDFLKTVTEINHKTRNKNNATD